jgi:hypothetical protein
VVAAPFIVIFAAVAGGIDLPAILLVRADEVIQ